MKSLLRYTDVSEAELTELKQVIKALLKNKANVRERQRVRALPNASTFEDLIASADFVHIDEARAI